jgi:hypothetical protein
MTAEEIEKIVMERYPKSDSEKRCRVTREEMRRLRDMYRKRLNESRTATGLQPEGSAEKKAI